MHRLLQLMVAGKDDGPLKHFWGVQTNDSPTEHGKICVVDVLGPQSATAGMFEQCGQQYWDGKRHATTQRLVTAVLSVYPISIHQPELVTQHLTVTRTVYHHTPFLTLLGPWESQISVSNTLPAFARDLNFFLAGDFYTLTIAVPLIMVNPRSICSDNVTQKGVTFLITLAHKAVTDTVQTVTATVLFRELYRNPSCTNLWMSQMVSQAEPWLICS
jgi:hypothetical protein